MYVLDKHSSIELFSNTQYSVISKNSNFFTLIYLCVPVCSHTYPAPHSTTGEDVRG